MKLGMQCTGHSFLSCSLLVIASSSSSVLVFEALGFTLMKATT